MRLLHLALDEGHQPPTAGYLDVLNKYPPISSRPLLITVAVALIQNSLLDNTKITPHHHSPRRISPRFNPILRILETCRKSDAPPPPFPSTGKGKDTLLDLVTLNRVGVDGLEPVRVSEGLGSGGGGEVFVPCGQGLEGKGCVVVVEGGDDC